MKRMGLKIFPKTFIGAMLLIWGIVIVAFFLISFLTPHFYRAYKEETLHADLQRFSGVLNNIRNTDMIGRLQELAQGNEYGIALYDHNGDNLFSRLTEAQTEYRYVLEENEPDSGVAVVDDIGENAIIGEQTIMDSEGKALNLMLQASMQPVDEVSIVLLRVLPYALLASLALSAVVSLIYAKSITAPVKAISQVTREMMRLERGAQCSVCSSDEIGELAGHINGLYSRLLTTIDGLEKEMQNVTAAEKERIDFMLVVSHELKTPLTAVKGMVEGMIYNVGVYKNRDEYLARCEERLDALAALINELLDTSKLERFPLPEDFVRTNIKSLVKGTVAAYEMIALSKQVFIDVTIHEELTSLLPSAVFSKALSNVIANAVNNTQEGGRVNIYTQNKTLLVENTCAALSQEEIRRAFDPLYSGSEGGHGLGLYLTERVLKVCGLKFDFIPCERGMQFVIYFE